MSQRKHTSARTAPAVRRRAAIPAAERARTRQRSPAAARASEGSSDAAARPPLAGGVAWFRGFAVGGFARARLQRARAIPWRPLAGALMGLLTLLLGARALILAHDAATGALGGQTNAAPIVGHPAPDVVFLDLRNQQVRLSSFRGKVVVLNFWYAACAPCQSEMPALERTYRADAARGVVILGADVSDDVPTITAFLQKFGITYPVVRDAQARAAVRYALYATPSTFVIDRQGIIRAKIEGPVDPQSLAGELDRILGKA